MPGHVRPIVHLHRQFALEAPQATEPALQVEVQHRTAGDGAKHLLDNPFDSPVHRCFRTEGSGRAPGSLRGTWTYYAGSGRQRPRPARPAKSEERRVGKEDVSTG